VRRSSGASPLDLDRFDWRELLLEEAAPRTRELSIEEEMRFWKALRADYHRIVELYIISGRRRSDWIDLTKFKVDRTQGTGALSDMQAKAEG
jgi:hypothetical protein